MSDILTFAKAEFFQLLPEHLILGVAGGLQKAESDDPTRLLGPRRERPSALL